MPRILPASIALGDDCQPSINCSGVRGIMSQDFTIDTCARPLGSGIFSTNLTSGCHVAVSKLSIIVMDNSTAPCPTVEAAVFEAMDNFHIEHLRLENLWLKKTIDAMKLKALRGPKPALILEREIPGATAQN